MAYSFHQEIVFFPMSCALREFPASTHNKYALDENSRAALLIEKKPHF
jgi:hypothetical protein